MRTKQGFDSQMGTNHFSHFVLTCELLPLLAKTPSSRVVNVSSMMHKFVPSAEMFKSNTDGQDGYYQWPAYARSKFANMLFTYELDRRLKSAGLSSPAVIAAHPGYTATNLQSLDKSAFTRVALRLMNAAFSQHVQYGGKRIRGDLLVIFLRILFICSPSANPRRD